MGVEYLTEKQLTKDELTVILYWATIADIHGMAGDNAELAGKLRRMRDEPEPLPVAPEPHVNERILEWGGLRNCKRNRKNGCAICQDCPFRIEIEQSEAPAPGPGDSDSNGGGA